jgi:amino acid adenylation domain-containing protein
VNGTRERFARLSPRKRALLAERNPLSFAQQRLWFLHQMEPETPIYNLAEAVSLDGVLDRAALAASLAVIVERHEVLRTVFPEVDGQPLQLVLAESESAVSQVDLCALPASLRGDEARRVTAQESLRPFNLSLGPLLRTVLIGLEERRHLLVLAMHHIVSDAWSMGVLTRELGALYGARIEGRHAALGELPVQYLDFARWQRAWLSGETLREQLEYWRRQLGGELPPLELPGDWPRPKIRKYRGASRSRQLPASLSAALAAYGRQLDATPFMVLLAAFQALLNRATGQVDFALGTPIANRTRAEIEGLIGFFVNTLVLRADLSGGPPFSELLARVRDTAIEAYRHQDLPFERLVEELQPVRDPSRTPLFQVAFALVNVPQPELRLPGLTLGLNRGGTATATARFDLLLLVDPNGRATVEYSTELFDGPTVGRLLGHFEGLLTAIARGETFTPLGELPLLGAAERHQVVVEWNATSAALPAESSRLQALFEAWAERAPGALAVTDGAGALTYGALEAEANRLAHLLAATGVTRGTLVAVRLSRGAGMVRVLLSILKAGGAYVPVERSFPPARVRTMLSSLGVRHLITERPALRRLEDPAEPPLGVEHLVCLDAGADPGADAELARGRRLWTLEDVERCPAARPPALNGAGDLAYVIFTSGSTGVPKGVVLRHGPVLNVLDWVNRTFAVGPADRVLCVASLGFDLSVYDIFGLLAAGGSIRVATEAELAEPARLVDILCREPITFWDSAPAALQQLVPFFPPPGSAGTGHLRLALLSGDWIPVTLPDEVRRAFPGTLVVSLGGATEAAIWSNFHVVGEVGAEAPSIPYGRPIDNARYHVLDSALGPCPIGMPGDLYIGGHCLAAGYAGDPGLTGDRFVPDPQGGEPGGRLYRTGDRARSFADGVLQFLGRLDHQVKIRGFRIELGEIEAVLRDEEGVREAVAMVREDRPGDRRLVAYVVGEGPEDLPAPAVLRDRLRQRLPEYMLPAAIVPLESLPVTANGKLDRRALPSPRAEMGARKVEPRDPVEARLAAIWSELLGREEIGVEDDFFALGGHSLVATQLMARVRREWEIDLPLRLLFEGPTVRRLAAAVTLARHAPAARAGALPTLEPDPGARYLPFPLSEVQQAYWLGRSALFDLGGVSSHAYSEIEVEALDVARFERALNRLIDRHDMLRAVILADGRQQVLPQVPFLRLEIEDLRESAEPELHLAAVRDRMSHQVLPADRWPLFEIRGSLLPGGVLRLHVSLDALVMDAFSFTLLVRELAILYADPGAALPALGLTYRDYVLAEARLADSDPYRQALGYWDERIPQMPLAPELPLCCDPASLSRPRFTRHSGRLERAAWERLKERAAARGLTPSGLVLAAFAEVLAAWSRSPRFTLNVTLFNRLPLHGEVDRVVGDFTSLVPLAVEVTAPTFEERARRLQQQLWDDLDHRFVGGIEVMRRLARARRLPPGALLPVVLTSTLTLPSAGASAAVDTWGARSVYGISQTPQVWLDHQVGESEGALVFNWDAIEEIFPPGMIADLFAAGCALLKRLAAGEAPWSDPALSLVPAHHLAVMAAANATAAPLPEGLLHGGFERQAAQHPERPAVITAGRCLSYGELLLRSRREARRLQGAGARRGRLVAVVMDKGWEQVVAVLAVLQAGAAYLPIAADLPQARIWQLLEMGEVELVLTREGGSGALAWPLGIRVLAVEGSTPPPEPFPQAPPAPPADPGDLAYVIFTSGSTGAPKGVMIDHRAALNTVADVNERFAVGGDDRILGLSSLGFDLSVWDVFGSLTAGAALVLPEPQAARDPGRWAALLAEHRVSVWNSVPALLEMLIGYCATRPEVRLDSLRLALLSGDWIPVDLPRRLWDLVPEVAVISLGGATEAAVWSIAHPIREVDPTWSSIPYGRPLRNQRFHVLDGGLRPCPFWVSGDLFIGGAGLAQGYYGDAETTARRFVADPGSGERLYRTGDVGRYLPGGDIEFQGREDLQVKILGHRIELGEIEAVLQGHPAVQAAAVAAVGEVRGRRSLVAYVVPRGGQPAPARMSQEEVAQLRFKLEERGLRRDLAGFPSVELPAAAWAPEERVAIWQRRRSHREFSPRELPGTALPALLGGMAADGLALVLAVRPGRVEGIAPGLYRVLPGAARLEPFAPGVWLERELYGEVNRPICDQAAFGLLLLAPAGDRRRHLLAAGRLGQRLMDRAADLGLGLCPIGSLDVSRLCHLCGDGEELIHSFLGGAAAVPDAPVVDSRAASSAPSAPSLAGAAALLEALCQVRLPGVALPKYRYPSAGNLYPVQVYLTVPPGGVEGLPAGSYYHDPLGHRLIRLSGEELETSGAPRFILAGDLAAIRPLYPDAAEDFCVLEAGYMSELLDEAAAALGLALAATAVPEGLEHRLALHGDHRVVAALSCGAAAERRAEAVLPAAGALPAGGASSRASGLAAVLRDDLAARLPSYMVPSSIVLLAALPLTANGKVDRQALLRLGDETAPARRPAVSPGGELERMVAEIFEQVLGAAEVGAHDNFFDLGGNSLHLVQAHARLCERLGREIPLLEVFNHPSVSELALFLGRGAGVPEPFDLAPGRVDQLRGGRELLRRQLSRRPVSLDLE